MDSRVEELPDQRRADLDIAHPKRFRQRTGYGWGWLWQAIRLGLDRSTWRNGNRLAALQAFDLLLEGLEPPVIMVNTRSARFCRVRITHSRFAVLRNEGSIEHRRPCFSHLVHEAGKSS